MAALPSSTLEQLVRDKVQEELDSYSCESIESSRTVTKTAKEVASAIMPGIANIITVAVSTAISSAVKDLVNKLNHETASVQKLSLLHKYDNDNLEQYMRRDNLRVFGIEEEDDENEEVLEAKLIGVAADMGVELESSDISVAHRTGKPGQGNRPVIVRFSQRKKRNEVMSKKKELKKKERKIFVNEDLTPLRATLLKMVKEQPGVKGVTTRDGRILAWLTDSERPVQVTSPDDLHKVGIISPNWKRLRLDQFCTE